MCKEIKVCDKHNIELSYCVNKIGNKFNFHCTQCRKERKKANDNSKRSERWIKLKSNQELIEKKRQRDKQYSLKVRVENPDKIKQNIEKYKQSNKFKERINYIKLKTNEGKFSNIYCIECNDVRLYGDKLCSKCKLIKKYTDAYNYTSLCKHCNKEFGIETKLNNLGKVARFNEYCSDKCVKHLILKNKKIERFKHRRKYKRIKEDKQLANKYGNKYEFISRTIVYRKHNYICTSCNVKCLHPTKDNYNQSNAATLDHIIPKSKGGSHTYDNVTLLCRSCNTMKSYKILTDYKRNTTQLEIEFMGYIPQGSQLQLQLQ